MKAMKFLGIFFAVIVVVTGIIHMVTPDEPRRPRQKIQLSVDIPAHFVMHEKVIAWVDYDSFMIFMEQQLGETLNASKYLKLNRAQIVEVKVGTNVFPYEIINKLPNGEWIMRATIEGNLYYLLVNVLKNPSVPATYR